MAAFMCRSKVICSHWIKIGRFYYCSMVGMTYRSVYNISTFRNVTSITEVRLERMEQNFKNERSLSKNKTNCIHRHNVSCFHMIGSCDVGKATQSKNYQTRNSNITGISRWYSDGREPPREKLPSLMDFPEIVWPNIFKTLRNWILANLIIRPYFDQEFGLPDFVLGSKQAVECVSNCLSRGDFAALENMVTQDTLQVVKRNISTFTLHQRQELALSKEDVYFSFPYQIGIMFNDDDSKFIRNISRDL
ncbi:uncharacterized protein LOC110826789 isoform X2 [Zootermopsis nevadensis]|uniref:uncharacterized protein LOC110826789 isoform X2 n=1 Tax=Zootermopsis nevadensis TaxID=136037 RepID=UPI000B8E2775|nr:uncharacterized protein LOC110826789 isoform X2 [Zootermopsis nevadensis]